MVELLPCKVVLKSSTMASGVLSVMIYLVNKMHKSSAISLDTLERQDVMVYCGIL